MEAKETNTILRYKRPCDSWLCPDCDTENNISLGKCTVCGGRKSPSTTILKQWTEADDRMVTPSKTDNDDYIPEEENKNIIIWRVIIARIIIAIIIIFLLIAISQGNRYAAYSLFSSRNYNEAKGKFQEITSYSNSSEIVKKCDYMVTSNYKTMDFSKD